VNGDQARVSVAVAVPPARAFEIFTAEIDRWWRRGARFRHAGQRAGIIHLEPCVGGRLFESIEGADAVEHVVEVGRVRVWQPPELLAFSWRNANFAAGESTDVEVAFAATASGTMVTVTHRGWAALRADHPARHGLQGVAFSRMIGLWWGDQVQSLRLLCRSGQVTP
jgi:uncharacterized protein YndB with AHSA1/START domain